MDDHFDGTPVLASSDDSQNTAVYRVTYICTIREICIQKTDFRKDGKRATLTE